MKIQFPKIDTRPFWKRLGLGAGVALGVVATQIKTTGAVPHSLSDLTPALVIGAAAAFPAGAAAAGLLTPQTPGGNAVVPALVDAVKQVLAAPAAQRKQDILDTLTPLVEAAAVKAVAERTSSFTADQLGKADPTAPVPTEDEHVLAQMESEGGVAPVIAG